MTKTNVMRLLDAAGIEYIPGEYEVDENNLSGSHAADMMGVEHDSMYKTLVLKGEKKGYLVCCIPVDEELDLKKVAKAAGDKKVEYDRHERSSAVDRIYPGRLFPGRDEEEIPYLYRRNSDTL